MAASDSRPDGTIRESLAGHRIEEEESRHLFVIDGRVILTTLREYQALRLLVERGDAGVSYAQLLALTEDPSSLQARTRLSHMVGKIREKLWGVGLEVVNMRNIGYLLRNLES